jgi:hypothetical protein
VTIEALLEKRGFLEICDAQGRRHVVSVHSMGKPQASGPGTTYLKFTGYKSLFVRCSLDQVKAAMKQARTLRQAQCATQRRAQLEFDFTEKETAAQLPTETAAANTHQADEVRNGES